MSKVICNEKFTCREEMCGAKYPHIYDHLECGKCPKDNTSECIKINEEDMIDE